MNFGRTPLRQLRAIKPDNTGTRITLPLRKVRDVVAKSIAESLAAQHLTLSDDALKAVAVRVAQDLVSLDEHA